MHVFSIHFSCQLSLLLFKKSCSWCLILKSKYFLNVVYIYFYVYIQSFIWYIFFQIIDIIRICMIFQKVTKIHSLLGRLYSFRISCKFCVLLMPRKNETRNPLTFYANADPGAKCCKMRTVKKGMRNAKQVRQNAKKVTQNAKKVTQNTLLYTFHFSHFAIIFTYFVISV